ncbi:active breakpoint cluster region-related protein [Diorhabda sublineata]|uniref:active breakpoint cluster region-related protein n=1 Tax=Diorhabda sublineata TaxID=1163346 RepID=UPI0024E157A2|nr:active breakpoint cluster region-related protein [Diorhabda sublineata]
MSVFGDFQQVWLQRFPDSPLPGAWEEDVRANLAKHKQKVLLLKEELEKEQFYVEYLERLLSDVEEHKKKISKEKSDESDDVIVDTVSKAEVTTTEVSKPATISLNVEEPENISANMCVNELSKQLVNNEVPEKYEPTAPPDPDPGTFVTVIEVNGLKQNTSPVKIPPKVPQRPDSLRTKPKTSSSDSRSSSSEFLVATDEPYYDMVATDEDFIVKSNHSSTENVFSSTSTLQIESKRDSTQAVQDPQSPGTSNYVNIEYFIHATKKNGNGHSSSEDEQEDITELRRQNDNSSYASSSSLESVTPASRRKFSHDGSDVKGETDRMYKSIFYNITDSESNYVDWLSFLLKYMKAIQATIGTSQPIVSESELNTIFYKIPELYNLHANFLEALKRHIQTWDTRIGEQFKIMATNLSLYGAFLSNYGLALDTVRKCSAANVQFGEISKNITCKQLSGQPISLEDLLHKPVARVQKNALVLHDLLKFVPSSHPDHHSLAEALNLTQNFLDQFNMIQTKSMFPATDRAQRRLVKNSFIVEYVDGHRKLRHLFLFNDVIACAKYKTAGRNEKYTFELKWFIPVEDILTLEETTANLHEVSQSNIVALKSQASNVRDQLRQEEKANEDKNRSKLLRGSDKYRKRLIELESQLVLVSPNLVYRIKNKQTGRTYMFFLSSDFERTQWIEAILTLQKTERTGKVTAQPFNMLELQTWITACRQFLKTNMGSYLLRSGNDESLLVGDLHVYIYDLTGLEYYCDLYIVIEVDFYGHFFQKAKTKVICNTNNPQWNENFMIDLEGCENLRVLVYRDGMTNPTLFGKHTQKLSRKWLNQHITEKSLSINGCTLRMGLKYIPCEISLRRVPTGKTGALFGEKIQAVCKRQKRDIPFIVTACIREVERRGMAEVGIYRVSGSSLDITKLKKSFETNSYEAEQLLKEVDIHSVTGILKLYLRELPEALFTDYLYPELLEAFNQSNGNLKRRTELLKECFQKLPKQNSETIKCILDHLIRVHRHESDNKMSLHNLATVFGPTLLRPAVKPDNIKQKDTLAAGTVDVMAQAGILYCYLQDLLNTSQRICR